MSPAQSAHFATYSPNNKTVLIPIHEQTLYTQDRIGLKKLRIARRTDSGALSRGAHGPWFGQLFRSTRSPMARMGSMSGVSCARRSFPRSSRPILPVRAGRPTRRAFPEEAVGSIVMLGALSARLQLWFWLFPASS